MNDIVCFDIDRGGRVQKIHDFASSGWEQRKDYESFWDWFREAIDENDRRRGIHGNEKVWPADKITPCYVRELN